MNFRLSLLLTSILLVSACTQPPSAALSVGELRINKPVAGTRMSAGYLALTNHSDREIRITSFDSPQFGAIEMHETDTSGDITRMRSLPELLILPGETVRLAPGGKHLMLMAPQLPFERVTLNVYSGTELLLSATTEARDP